MIESSESYGRGVESPRLDVLITKFRDYLKTTEEPGIIEPIANSYGFFKFPDHPPKFVVSVDFCEVIRQTGMACAAEYGGEVEYPYNAVTGLSELQTVDLVTRLMNNQSVEPVQGASEICMILRDLREIGGLVIGNTSTLPGCELATIDFLKKNFRGAFDGINFNTGGHHSTELQGSKAWAVLSMLSQIDSTYDPQEGEIPVFAIDDRPHHNDYYHQVFGDAARTFMPLCRGENPVPEAGNSRIAVSPLRAFRILRADVTQVLYQNSQAAGDRS